MGGKVLEIINREEDVKTGIATIDLLDTDFEDVALLINNDTSYPDTLFNINNLDYLEVGKPLSEELLDDTRGTQLYLHGSTTTPKKVINITDVIADTNAEIDRIGSRISKPYFDFINDINASWFHEPYPNIFNKDESAQYEVLKQYAENCKKLYGFYCRTPKVY